MTDEYDWYLDAVRRGLAREANKLRNRNSDLASEQFVRDFGIYLLGHHSHSADPFTKDKFGEAIKKVLERGGRNAELTPRGFPGRDIVVDGEGWSLKTQADANIEPDRIHISKFMELGKGKWEMEADLAGLRDQMIAHMSTYERIFTLRCLQRQPWNYELVEIPKSLLLRSESAACRMKHDSTQTPKPGICVVEDPARGRLYELYFDGGTERKLQVRKLLKSECFVHAKWRF